MNGGGVAVGYLDVASCEVVTGTSGHGGSVVYLMDSGDHPTGLGPEAESLAGTLVRVPVDEWDTSLTPWPAPSPWRGTPAFGGQAHETLDELLEALPAIERAHGLSPARRGICGYSLAGLFSLYALVSADAFSACGCVSGSVWYEGWVPWLRTLDRDLAGRFAHLSVGSREKNARQPILRTVEDNMATCADLLREHGCAVEYTVGPGTHFQHERERVTAALSALDHFLA